MAGAVSKTQRCQPRQLRRRPHILTSINIADGTICMAPAHQPMPQRPPHGKTLVTLQKHSVTLISSCNKFRLAAIHKIKGLARLAR
ncbi:hypothetical protein CBM2587_A200027 [Cupriavidus taiwanensis]|uniref:Uncharacterized protein n=1 Tax=Cupriavidus taiwanensis TaxID=164546 RepID=A0A975X0I5_9BURK|nr:hypothetical protein CBM2587_A200027 [Cupriavidus taiwanensis]